MSCSDMEGQLFWHITVNIYNQHFEIFSDILHFFAYFAWCIRNIYEVI